MESIKTLLQSDRIAEALERWLTESPPPELERELIQLDARYENHCRRERAGVESEATLTLERNRIRQALIDLTEVATSSQATAPQSRSDVSKRVAFLEANPLLDRNLQSNIEWREISTLLDKYPDRFALHSAFAITLEGLAATIDRYQPDVVHLALFSTADFLILHDAADREIRVANADVLTHFDLPSHRPAAIFFNTWIGTDLAAALSRRGSFVIGANALITSLAAIEFATGFYMALGYGKDYATAFALGRNVLSRGSYAAERDKLFAYAEGERVATT